MADKMLANLSSPWRLKLYMLLKLPTLLHWNVKVEKVNYQSSTVSIKMGWRSQNPFRSIYFAAQMGTAEFSTGVLALLAIGERKDVSMLVISVNSNYYKKATGILRFHCDEGDRIKACIEQAISTKEPQVLALKVKGVLENGEVASEVEVVWSFKAK